MSWEKPVFSANEPHCGRPKVTSAATPTKLFKRYIAAAHRATELRRSGTKISQELGVVREKNKIALVWQDACNGFVWRARRAEAVQFLREAAMEKEMVNMEAILSHSRFKHQSAENKKRNAQRCVDGMFDTFAPPSVSAVIRAEAAGSAQKRPAATSPVTGPAQPRHERKRPRETDQSETESEWARYQAKWIEEAQEEARVARVETEAATWREERAAALDEMESFRARPHVWRFMMPCASGSCGMCEYCHT